MTYANKDIYVGNWEDDKKSGQGTMTYNNGNNYKGNWINDKKSGQGTMTYANKDIYVGNWKDDKKSGQGTMTYFELKYTYEGTWKNDLKNGDGIIIINGINLNSKWHNDILLSKDIIPSTKPIELRSVAIKKQKYGDCWAHSCSRNFVRTLQILDVIKYNYIEEFYDLFYTILTIDSECDKGKTNYELIILFNYLKKNYKENIFSIKYKDSKCQYDRNNIEENILKMEINDKNDFICNLEYLFNNDLLFIGNYYYRVDINGDNKPSEAIKNMLYYKLQPYVAIQISNYLFKNFNKYTNSEITIPESEEYNSDYNSGCYNSNHGHAVNLRKWTTEGIEFKNSWGNTLSKDGNFSVKDLKYLICKIDQKTYYDITFTSLMFDYNNLNSHYKNIVDTKIKKYHSTFDINKENLKTENYYKGSYNSYGLFHGFGRFQYDNNYYSNYKGHWKNGFRNGNGQIIYKNNNVYTGNWKNDKKEGKGMMSYRGIKYNGIWKDNDGEGTITYNEISFYKGNWENYKRKGSGVMFYENKDIYNGNWNNDLREGEGIITYKDGSSYNGYWKNDKREGKGVMTFTDGSSYNGTWKDDIKVELQENNNNDKSKYIKYKLKYLNIK